MLRFIIGTNGEARRKMLYEDIAKESSSILIVPEQYSFESEKLLDEFLGPEKAGNVEVLGFSRLCNSIFRKFGGIAGEYTDDTAKLLLKNTAMTVTEIAAYLGFSSCHHFSGFFAKRTGVSPTVYREA